MQNGYTNGFQGSIKEWIHVGKEVDLLNPSLDLMETNYTMVPRSSHPRKRPLIPFFARKCMSLELIGSGPFSNWVGRYIFYVSSFLFNFLSIFVVNSFF